MRTMLNDFDMSIGVQILGTFSVQMSMRKKDLLAPKRHHAKHLDFWLP